MNIDRVFKDLEAFLTGLSIDIKYGRGYFEGGLYRYRDQKVLYLNKANTVDNHVSIILGELNNLEMEGIDLSPRIKEILNNQSQFRR